MPKKRAPKTVDTYTCAQCGKVSHEPMIDGERCQDGQWAPATLCYACAINQRPEDWRADA